MDYSIVEILVSLRKESIFNKIKHFSSKVVRVVLVLTISVTFATNRVRVLDFWPVYEPANVKNQKIERQFADDPCKYCSIYRAVSESQLVFKKRRTRSR